MGGSYVNISLRSDEREAIQQLMKEHNLKKHQVLKLAIRQFLFPQEQTIPLNGKEAHVVPAQLPNYETAKTITVEPSEEDEDVFAELIDKNE